MLGGDSPDYENFKPTPPCLVLFLMLGREAEVDRGSSAMVSMCRRNWAFLNAQAF